MDRRGTPFSMMMCLKSFTASNYYSSLNTQALITMNIIYPHALEDCMACLNKPRPSQGAPTVGAR